MDAGDIIGIAFGAVGSVAGVWAALWVYRRERRERERSRETAHKEQLASEERREKTEQERRRADEERHARDVLRAKHENDYRATAAALEKLKEIAYNIEMGEVKTRSEMKEIGIEQVQEQLDRLANRLPRLEVQLVLAGVNAHSLEFSGLPDNIDPTIRRAISEGIKQFLAAKETDTIVEKATAKLNREWEA